MEGWVIALVVALAVGGLAHAKHIPIALPLVLAGLVLAGLATPAQRDADITHILPLVLAPLVFGTALNMPYLDVRKARRAVFSLAVGLVTLTTLCIGLLVHLVVPSIPFAVACALGAVLAPTDAVAVQSVGRSGVVPRRVVQLLEAESLINDGTALTALRVAVTVVVAGTVTPVEAGWTLLTAVAGGVLVGAVAGRLTGAVLHRSVDPVVGGGILTAVPFATYFGAEAIHGSGLLALVVAGVWISQQMAEKHEHHIRLQASALYGPVNFVLESVSFLLVGLELPSALMRDQHELKTVGLLVAVVTVALFVLRVGWVACTNFFNRISTRRDGSPWRTAALVAWAGTRGPISVLAGFSIPLVTATGEPFPHRDLLIAVTLCCVLASVVFSLSFAPVARFINAPMENDEAAISRARLYMAKAALTHLDELVAESDKSEHTVSEDVVGPLRDSVVERIQRHRAELRMGEDTAAPEELKMLARAMIDAERAALEELRTSRALDEALSRELLAELDRRKAAFS